MDVTREEVLRCARLAGLELEESEIGPLAQDMGRLLSRAERLADLDLTDVPPYQTTAPLPLREDAVTASLPREAALGSAPDQAQGQFRVPRVL